MSGAAEGSGVRRLLFLGIGLILLAGVGGVVCASLGGSIGGFDSPRSSGLSGGGVTARQAFVYASEVATRWQQDARLAAVSGQRLKVGVHSTEKAEWAFQFFSPSTQHLALILVSDGVARVVHDSLSPYPVTTFSAEEWRVDSDQAQRTWWDRGGSIMVAQQPNVDLLLQLRVSGEGGEHPVWTVAGLIAGTGNACTVMVDAVDGAAVGP